MGRQDGDVKFYTSFSLRILHSVRKLKVLFEWCLCRASDFLCTIISRAATQHRAQQLEEIPIVVVPTIVISNLLWDTTGIVYAYLLAQSETIYSIYV